MSRSRDISNFLGKTELNNSQNEKLLLSTEAGLDSASVISLSQSTALSVYSSVDSLPVSGLAAGQQAFVQGNSRLYMSNGSGWYNVALINLTPTMSLDQSGTIQLAPETLTSTVTITAQDSDNPDAILSYSVESDGNMLATGVTVSQDSSVFTITSLSADSGGVAGNFTLTFKTTDQINTASEALAFNLAFSNAVDSSSSTLMLMKADGNSTTNANITYQNSSDASTGFTETGTPQASTFSPYRSGGYSAYFDGTGDRFSAVLPSQLGDGDFTVEAYVYIDPARSSGSRGIFQISGTAGGLQANATTNVAVAYRSSSFSYNWVVYANSAQNNTSTASVAGKWTHVALVRSGSTTKLYIDGSEVESISDSTNYNATRNVAVGGYYGTSNLFDGYIRDFRVVKGTAVYTSAFTPPTEALSAISGTELLAAHLPYFADGSTNDLTITLNGNAHTEPFGPYDYEAWTANDHGGSVYFDGTGDRLELASLDDLSGGSYTIEGWYYFNTDPNSSTYLLWTLNDDGGNGYAQLQTLSSGTTLRLQQRGGSYLSDGSYDFVPDTWYHIATVWDGTNMKVYVNGTQALSSTTNVVQNAGNGLCLNGDGAGNLQFGGYIADFRIVTSAQYTAAFTPPTSPLSHTGSGTKLLMNNKSDANIYDAAAANTLLLNSAAQSSTAERKFTTSSSILINGTDDKVTIENLGVGGDMTFEGWFMQTTLQANSYRTLLVASTYTGTTPFGLFTYATQVQLWGLQSGVQITGSFSQNTWHHVAVVRNSGTWTLYIDGTSQGTNTNNGTYTFADTTDWSLGAQGSNASDFIGYLQDWRFSDRAVYTTNFTPPTAEFSL